MIDQETRAVSCARPFESDHRGKFVERCHYSKSASPGFDTEFVVAAAQVLNERVTTDHHRRAPIGLEPRIGLSLALSRPWSHPTLLLA